MTEETTAPVYPPPTIPTVFVDTIASGQTGTYVCKFYLARFDPSVNATGQMTTAPVAQMVMPTLSVVYTHAFLGRMIDRLIQDKTLTQDQVDSIRASEATGMNFNVNR